MVRWYTYRWRIERYHFTLKSGCRLEDLQLETAERLRRALALYAIVGSAVAALDVPAQRQEPQASCEPAVSRRGMGSAVASFPTRGVAAAASRRPCGRRCVGSAGWEASWPAKPMGNPG